LEKVNTALEVPVGASYENDADSLKTVLNAAVTSLVQLGQTEMMSEIVEKAKSKFPKLSNLIDEAVQSTKLQDLWKKGQAWMHSPEKDFAEGQTIFSAILKHAPEDYYATLLLGACYTWAAPSHHNPHLGETYIRKALFIDPNRPNAYSLLAQNCLSQGKNDIVTKIVTEMLSKKFTGIESDSDQQEKIIEGLNCAKQVLGHTDPSFKAMIAKAKSQYPYLDKQISIVASNKNNKENCYIM